MSRGVVTYSQVGILGSLHLGCGSNRSKPVEAMTGNGFTGSSGSLPYIAVFKPKVGGVSKRSVGGVGSGVLGFLGLSALTGVLITTALTPALAVTGLAANNGIALFENLPGYLNISALSAKSDIYATRSDGSVAHLASFFDEDRQEVGWDAIS